MKGGLFLEGYFAYAVYDYLSIKKEEGNYETIIQNFGVLGGTLEKIAEEAFSTEQREKTRVFLEELIVRKNKSKLIKEILFLCKTFYFKRQEDF